eukprot:scaffold89231_cov25-Tisochrysis_lutea.AAC.2
MAVVPPPCALSRRLRAPLGRTIDQIRPPARRSGRHCHANLRRPQLRPPTDCLLVLADRSLAKTAQDGTACRGRLTGSCGRGVPESPRGPRPMEDHNLADHP